MPVSMAHPVRVVAVGLKISLSIDITSSTQSLPNRELGVLRPLSTSWSLILYHHGAYMILPKAVY